MQVAMPLGLVLAVDDEATSLTILRSLLEDFGQDILSATNGKEALAVLQNHKDQIDVVVLDRMMPELDGIAVVQAMKRDPALSSIPVIMVTGSTRPEEIKEGLDAGVFYYLTKPYNDVVLQSVLASAMQDSLHSKETRAKFEKQQAGLGFISQAQFEIKAISEARDLAMLLSGLFHDHTRSALALMNLMVNAVEHGNLEIGYDQKGTLLEAGRWHDEITSRTNNPTYNKRRVKVTVENESGSVAVHIADEGKGFDYMRYLDVDPMRVLGSHGRGIAQAVTAGFDELRYSNDGATVMVRSRKP